MRRIKLNWQCCDLNKRCRLVASNQFQYIPDDLFGVYVIWEFITPHSKNIIRVGQGNIKERLCSHKDDSQIVGDSNMPRFLYVAYAKVDEEYVDGVEAFLGHALDPNIGKRFPNADMIEVNFPVLG
ncbi:MAG: hypothetical protein GX294_05160 [Candidatus Cloacimonetes bacterium]|nr:hypothetical protein [Candidatus Cloacimonadota bacterium]